MVNVLTLSRGQNLIFEWKSVMLILIIVWDYKIKSVKFMPIFHFFSIFYKTHVTTSRTHEHYCDQVIGMLKAGDSVKTFVCHFKLLKAIFYRLQHHKKIIGSNKDRRLSRRWKLEVSNRDREIHI